MFLDGDKAPRKLLTALQEWACAAVISRGFVSKHQTRVQHACAVSMIERDRGVGF